MSSTEIACYIKDTYGPTKRVFSHSAASLLHSGEILLISDFWPVMHWDLLYNVYSKDDATQNDLYS